MGEIKFRGKEIDHGEWIYGYYYRGEIDPSRHFIIDMESYCDYEVDPETVSQFTGLHDKNGKEIYENDETNNGEIVIFADGAFRTTYEGDKQGGILYY